MCVYIYTRIYICKYIYICIYMRAYEIPHIWHDDIAEADLMPTSSSMQQVCTYMCVQIYIQIYIYVFIVYMYTYVYMYICM